MLATMVFMALNKLKTKLRAFENNQYSRVWFKIHCLTIGSNVFGIVSAIVQV
jgi:hypothetical protein